MTFNEIVKMIVSACNHHFYNGTLYKFCLIIFKRTSKLTLISKKAMTNNMKNTVMIKHYGIQLMKIL